MSAAAALLLGLGVFRGGQAVLGLSSHADVLAGELWDSDAYMRLVRLEALLDGGEWWQQAVARSNAPLGETLHWARPLDLLLLLGALPLAPWLGLKPALFAWGATLSPLLGIACLSLTAWQARRWLPGAAQPPLLILFGLQPALAATFSVGRPDHHALLLLALAAGLAVLQGLALRPCRRAGAGRGAGPCRVDQ